MKFKAFNLNGGGTVYTLLDDEYSRIKLEKMDAQYSKPKNEASDKFINDFFKGLKK